MGSSLFSLALLLSMLSCSLSFRVGFGSCFQVSSFLNLKSNQALDDIFKFINEEELDVWIWLGDFAYTDHSKPFQLMGTENKTIYGKEVAIREFEITYNNQCKILQASTSDYKELRTNNFTRVIGIWDDNDYGINDGDSFNPEKVQQKELFLHYIDEPRDSERSLRNDSQGIYTSYNFTLSEQASIRVVLLDVRYHATKFKLLGEEQWQWLEETLNSTNEDLYLVSSGIQVLSDNNIFDIESWTISEVHRLIQLFVKYQKSAILLSGDVHNAHLQSPNCRYEDLGYNLIEITSSGLTHTCNRNSFNQCKYIMNAITPHDFMMTDFITELNYGVMDFNLNKEGSLENLQISIKGRGTTFLEVTFPFKDLRFKKLDKKGRNLCKKHMMNVKLQKYLHLLHRLIEKKCIISAAIIMRFFYTKITKVVFVTFVGKLILDKKMGRRIWKDSWLNKAATFL